MRVIPRFGRINGPNCSNLNKRSNLRQDNADSNAPQITAWATLGMADPSEFEGFNLRLRTVTPGLIDYPTKGDLPVASPSEPDSKSRSAPQLVQFGPFEVNLETGELRKQGIRIRLQPKPWQILRTLLESPGSVVTREELRSRLWPEDTFIDFESGVNTAINRLRLALSDSADHPRYVETLSRTGYRFVAPVHSSPVPATIAEAPPPTSILGVPAPQTARWYRRLLPAVTVFQTLAQKVDLDGCGSSSSRRRVVSLSSRETLDQPESR
jgi:DNA-binding winged helix-turn-helix (wHTH) protein